MAEKRHSGSKRRAAATESAADAPAPVRAAASSSSAMETEPHRPNGSRGGPLPPHVEEVRSRVRIGPSHASNTAAVEDPRAFDALGYDNSFSLEDFRENFRIKVLSSTTDRMVFSMIGVSAAIANAFRRILLSEIPTMAIETVNIYQNTSIVQDEVLAHRLGLIPIRVDPRKFKYLYESNGELNEENTLVFTLKIECTANEGTPEYAATTAKYKNSVVYSKDLVWEPQGSQLEELRDVSPVHPDIIIAKMRPGQEIEAELLVHKGIGKTHAKWSPVCTASYRLMPEIRLVKPFMGEEALELVRKCPAGVFDIEDLGGTRRARVAAPLNCTMCRECVREPGWEKEKIRVSKVRDHFIFSVESTGIYTPKEVVQEAIMVLKNKCESMLEELRSPAS